MFRYPSIPGIINWSYVLPVISEKQVVKFTGQTWGNVVFRLSLDRPGEPDPDVYMVFNNFSEGIQPENSRNDSDNPPVQIAYI